MKAYCLLFVSLLVIGAVCQTDFTIVLEGNYPAGSPARFIELNVPDTDVNGLSILVTSANGTEEISFGVSVNAPCLFEYGGEPYLSGCIATASQTGATNSTVFVPAGDAFLSVINPSKAAFEVLITADACSDARAVGPYCKEPLALFVGENTVTLLGVGDSVYFQLPLLTTADGSVSSLEVSFSSAESVDYTDLVFGSLPDTNGTENMNSGTEDDLIVYQPFVALEGEAVASGQYYYLGMASLSDANATISFTVALTNCSAGEYYVITEGDDEECLDIPTLNSNSAIVVELTSSFFNDNDWGYFKLNTTFFGSSSSLTVGALPLEGSLPSLFLRCGNIPTEDQYDIVLQAEEPVDDTALFYSADLSDSCTWFLGFHADDGDEKDGFDLWLNSLCPHDCNGNGNCTSNVCECNESWTGIDCATAVAPGQSPDGATESPRFWDIDEWSPAAWVAVVLIVLLVIAVISLSVGLAFMSKKWNDARRGSYDKL